MKTKIVYVVVASSADIYIEQLYASSWSLKYYNPDAKITVVTDSDTYKVLQDDLYKELREIIDNIDIVEFDRGIGNMEKSRRLKTSLRNIIDGDYLFIDTDTVICDDLSFIDNLKSDIAAVSDMHRERKVFPYIPFVQSNYKKIFNRTLESCRLNYFNSGVMYVRDNSKTREFYRKWHDNWRKCLSKGYKYDQLSLLATDIEMDGLIETLDGIYNCQITKSIRYLHKAKVLHFFKVDDYNIGVHPFLDKTWYIEIKNEGVLSARKKEEILNCKSLFGISTNISGVDYIPIKKTPGLFWYLRLQPQQIISRFKRHK